MSGPPPPTTETTRDAFARGVRDVLPIVVGVIPFGLVVGASATASGLTTADALFGSLVVFAGASQLAMIELLGRDAPWLVAVLTAGVINLRMVMYSASLSPLLAGNPPWQRAVAAGLLVDQSYALTVTRYAGGTATPRSRLAYLVGTGVPLWVNWQIVTLVGAYVGSSVPEEIPLEATIPLVFLALLVPAVRDRPARVAAVVGGSVAVLAAALPANLGLVVGAVSGIVAGAVTDARRPDRQTDRQTDRQADRQGAP